MTSSKINPTPTLTKVLLGLIFAGIAIRLLLACTTLGTNDLFFFVNFAAATAKFGVFKAYEVIPYWYNHPPITALGLDLIGHTGTSEHLHALADAAIRPGHLSQHPISEYVPYAIGMRLIPILADCLSIFLAFRLGGAIPAVVVALSPTLILTSGYHGNTDCIVAAGILLAFDLTRQNKPLLAGIATALTGAVKLPGLLTIPTFASVTNKESRIKYLLASILLTAAIFGTWVVFAGKPFIHNVIAYHPDSKQHWWGLTYILGATGIPSQAWFARATSIGAWACSFFCAWRLRNHPNPAAPTAIALLGALALANNVGVQYFAWVVPIAALLSPTRTMIYSCLAAVMQGTLYVLWAKAATPSLWYFSNAIANKVPDFWYELLSLPIWLFIVYWVTSTLLYPQTPKQ